ncbi:MAG TPA: Rieske (2Fe-2S) protein [Phycisphaerae bacterium]|nr:Rieske (2Fe-2S) protein [Phycisphaerae bacterium]
MGNGCGCDCEREDVSRRVVLGVMAAAAVAVPGLSGTVRAEDASPPTPADGAKWVKTVKPGDVPDKGAKAVKGPDLKAIVILVRSGKEIRALSPACTHKRCDVAPVTGKQVLHCKCHGAEFDFEGKNTRGPGKGDNVPPKLKPLGYYALRLNGDGVIEVDTSATVDAEAKGASLMVEG